MVVGGPLESVRVGRRWGPRFVECEVHLTTLSPVASRLHEPVENRGHGLGGKWEGKIGDGGEGNKVVPKGGIGMAELKDSRRRIREQKRVISFGYHPNFKS